MIPRADDEGVRAVMASLARGGVEVRLFGGWAVGLDSRVAAITTDVELRAPDDPIRLVSLIRWTSDVDVAVIGPIEAAERVLATEGFTRDARVPAPPSRWRRPALQIDLVGARADGDSELERLLAHLVARPEIVRADGLALFSPGDLVVLKACARRDRREPKDLVDVARIALLDRVAEPLARARLAVLAPGLPDFARRAIAALREEFVDEESPGPFAFLEACERHVSGLAFEDEREIRVRSAVASAVREMLEPVTSA